MLGVLVSQKGEQKASMTIRRLSLFLVFLIIPKLPKLSMRARVMYTFIPRVKKVITKTNNIKKT